MKKLFLALLCCFASDYLFAQADSGVGMKEVIITGFQNTNPKATSLNLEPYTLKELDRKAPVNLSDALANIPGISQVSTGNAISKPNIRGLYGNRILVLLSGLRFDNQQFQDEHGMGLSQIGIDRVEVIKGPASILYGTDALGGVINVVEETPDALGKTLDFTTRLYSNTLGTLTDIGLSNYKANKSWWRVRGGIESNADYSDGNNTSVLDSRYRGYYAKAGFGFTKGIWTMNNSYNFSYNQFGFIVPDLNLFFEPDGRWSRSMKGPHHNVMLNILSSQNTFALKSSTLKINAGVQSNRRMEDEGGGEISLDMHLISALENARWEKNLTKNILFVCNQQFTYESNTNLGKRRLIPDASMAEANLSGFLRFHVDKVNIETGIGFNYKHISTYKTTSLNDGNPDNPNPGTQPFKVGRQAANAMVGCSYNPTEKLNVKGNISSGDRTANLAELSSNGLHEGYYRYEIGDPALKMEKNINGDVTLEIDTRQLFLSASAYYNRFFDYIYLDSLGTLTGFPVYKFKQQDAKIYGGEFIGIYKPSAYRWLEVKETFSATRGVLDKGGNLPFIPAYKSLSSIIFQKEMSAKLNGLYIEPEFEYVFAQNNPANFERPSTDYGLINIYGGFTTRFGKHSFNWTLSVRNLLNKTYYDHLSRLQDPTLFPVPIYNQGRNFVLSLNTSLGL